jgi:hypothetical protein
MTIGGAARELHRRNPVLSVATWLNVALALVLIALLPFDTAAPILGISRWVKPLKFAISIAVFTGTMGWLLAYLQGARPRAVTVISWTIFVSMVGEIAIITGQAARGVRSHFNADSALDATLFSVMGALIALNTIAAAYAAWLFFRARSTVTGAYLTGIRLGFLVFLFASAVGGLMVGQGSHTVGVHDGGPGLPFVNWSTEGGDLRVAHFAGMHALQGLPLLGWLLDRARKARGVTIVRAAALGWTVATALLIWGALMARPLLRMAGH